MMKTPNKRGFTLIEIMVVVVIIGILASIGFPAFSKYQCRSKQSEARSALRAIYVAQTSYRNMYNIYIDNAFAGTSLFPIVNGVQRYDLSVVGDATTFTATASGKAGIDMDGDLWIVNHAFDLKSLTPTYCN